MKYSQAIEKLLNQIDKHSKESYQIILYPKTYSITVKRIRGVKGKKHSGCKYEELINLKDASKMHIHEYQEFIEVEVFDKLVDDFKKGVKDE